MAHQAGPFAEFLWELPCTSSHQRCETPETAAEICAFQSAMAFLSQELPDPTLSLTVKPTMNALLQRFAQFICPPAMQEIKHSKMQFREVTGLPNVFGCIDGTHEKFVAPPGNDEDIYVHRKNFHSINVQAEFAKKFKSGNDTPCTAAPTQALATSFCSSAAPVQPLPSVPSTAPIQPLPSAPQAQPTAIKQPLPSVQQPQKNC
ncbi:hypothetical protein PoB_005295700 [Plakobranchus ocellatus]|uniref:Uncharacterized protein n=1 Tax=Plakobranchus ocellatus TaxID=259542 RepID=A0AAV4C505_9GAST|nr:hypothetical protein PoB_005295700 [Plakobranchus ocellatus]